jgi:DNA polymerase elongation subunit (family B)
MQDVNFLKKCLFFDIETVGRYQTFAEFSEKEPEIAKIWVDKASTLERYKEDPQKAYEQYSGLYPEYGKIISIAFGYWDALSEKWKIEHYDIESSTEKEMLWQFAIRINRDFKNFILGGFNIKNFDIPYVFRRMLINRILPPACFDIGDKKPWEVRAHDLFRIWSEGNTLYGMINFDLVCNLMDIPSPKDGDVVGNTVSKNYFEGNISEITVYCRKDVQASIRLAMSFAPEKLEEPNPYADSE